MSEKKSDKIEMKSANLDDIQKTLVINHLWLSLRQTFVRMHELNGPAPIIDMQKRLILGAKNSHTTGLPVEKEKAVIDTVVTLLEGLVTVDGN